MSARTTSLRELQWLVDLVREDHPSLGTIPLEPDGKYQTRTVTLDAVTCEVTECLRQGFRGRKEFPTLYCAWGKCRVGSTALNNLFGAAGLPSYYQPVKTLLRYRLTAGAGAPWIVPRTHLHVFAKETGGPYVLAECLFIPMQALREAGYPADKLHLIVLDREPSSSLASWLDKWSERVPASVLVRNYIIAALNMRRVEAYARRHRIPVTHYVYEASKESVSSVHVLFERLGLSSRFSERAVTDWNEIGQLDSGNTKIIYPVEPDPYIVPGLHGSDTAYRYHARGAALADAAPTEMLARFGVADLYRGSVAACARDLGFDAPAAARLFGIDVPAGPREAQAFDLTA
jgi:hypothetical protein